MTSKVDGLNLDGKKHNPVSVPGTKDPLDARRIYQFRKQRGVNLGSWFSLESWLTPSIFQNACEPKGSEFDVVKNCNPDEARALLEKHWANFINDGDWKWMAQHGVNSVRLPIGYFHFLAGADGGKLTSLLKGTEYEKHAAVYQGAWQHITAAIDKARAHNIGVLIDLHGAPGAQNKDGHSGVSTGKAGLWHGLSSSSNQKLTIDILVALAEAVAPYENVVGLELLNEPENSSGLESFYNKAISSIRSSKVPEVKQLPLYLGDGWATDHYATYVGEHSSAGSPLVLDHHVYRCFTPGDQNTPAEAHAQKMDPNSNGPTSQWFSGVSRKAHGSIIIGEWSGALNPRSFELSQIQSKLEARTLWTKAEWHAFERHTAGYYYWTLKKEGGPDPGWCFYTAVEKGSLPPSLNPLQGRTPSPQQLQGPVEQEFKAAYDGHVNYWKGQGGKYEHWRFEQGFRLGTTDAFAFLQSGSEVGFAYQLADLRLAAHEKETEKSSLLWEFEHGYKAGVAAVTKVLYA